MREISGTIRSSVKKVYISGKISGLQIDKVKRKFQKAEQVITTKGGKPISPIKNGLPYTSPWILHMIVDIILLVGCDSIYLLSDWENSRGAKIEKAIAELLNKELIFE